MKNHSDTGCRVYLNHNGGECPVAEHVKVEYQLRSGAKGSEPAKLLEWHHEGARHDIIAYRVIDNDGVKDE